ncbi:hypothetical protein BG004_007664 [Podila humilis]|nr:hypothetical protein BG004_007664 [Podila humilis]
MTEASTPSSTSTGGGHLTKKQRKEQFEALGALQTQLDVSVSLARNTVASWLSADGFSDDDEDIKSADKNYVAPSEVKARQPGLGLGAKYISHRDAMRHVPLNAFDSKLKRQMTGGVNAADQRRAEEAERNALPDKYQEHKLMMAQRRKELQEQQEEEEDSKTRNVGSSSSSNNNSTSIDRSGTGSSSASRLSASIESKHQHPKTKKGTVAAEASAATTTPAKAAKGAVPAKKYQAAIHPAALKASPTHSAAAAAAAVSMTPKSTGTPGGKKRMAGDFFSTYMDERAQKMAKKKKKAQAKGGSDDDE